MIAQLDIGAQVEGEMREDRVQISGGKQHKSHVRVNKMQFTPAINIIYYRL